MKKDEIFDSVIDSSRGLSMAAIWQHLGVAVGGPTVPYEVRVTYFFEILDKLLREGLIKFARNDVCLSGDINSQIEEIRQALPCNPDEDDLDGFGCWFLISAPAGVVWIFENGFEQWT
ncbi:DUF596 domain-containing protein [Achromobacter deleyi]|nr:DUF596 domain-containing protein [Achromobacter deleyi]